ncbi:hypothetical protein JCGZ_13107 [Jatropha curcas]|uniref:Uncharacterized protein n=1 Tax=Jatropha curcas TaxID=180498 RepID=A0A067KAX7_JATCU|nr:hypothetical protein JCGZ_13107 [Jatropha curcas]
MANDPTEHLHTKDQDTIYGDDYGESTLVPPSTIDSQVVAALAQAYSQFTTVLKCLLEKHLAASQYHPRG